MRDSQQAAQFDSEHVTSYQQLPEVHATPAIDRRVAALRQILSDAAASINGLVCTATPRIAALQEPLSEEQLVLFNIVCAEVWPDSWVRPNPDWTLYLVCCHIM